MPVTSAGTLMEVSSDSYGSARRWPRNRSGIAYMVDSKSGLTRFLHVVRPREQMKP
jgi:hypothetical protein